MCDFNCIDDIGDVIRVESIGLPHTEGYILVFNRGLVDHNPLIFHVPMQLENNPFQIFNYMLDLPDFFPTLSNVWSSYIPGDPMLALGKKIKLVKQALRELNNKHNNAHSNVIQARVMLGDTQDKLKDHNTVDLFELEKLHIDKLNRTLLEEEHLMLQKFRANWNVNKVLAIHDSADKLVHGQNACAQVAVKYFRDFLGTTSAVDDIDLSSVHCATISPTQASMLEAHVTNETLHCTLKKMKKNKAPGPDGVNAEFFLVTWSITGELFCKAVKDFFKYGFIHQGPNSTFTALIPKTASQSIMQDFRPISLCTVLYKCISKTIPLRVKSLLVSIIDSS
ncbi:uncharacterized protein LOC141673345 [Apium graveolens]|uniref:uncharacterized protein LOC141673345 n=1 Tax=Apium graveolens TaxID=4045 RepID=UPI003D7BEAB1